MSLNKITRRALAATLTLMGYASCTTEQPDLYGTPLLYGPIPDDSVIIDTMAHALYGTIVTRYNKDVTPPTEKDEQ